MANENKSIRMSFLECGDNRLKIKFDKSDGIHTWGDDNAYPSLIWSLIGSSITARRCWDENAKNIRGKGFGFEGANEIIVNSEGQTINQLLTVAAKELAALNNVFFHVNYNAANEVTSVSLKPCTDMRIGKSDSKGYAGKIIDFPNWDKSIDSSVKKSDFIAIDRFNPNPEVIAAQVEAAKGWNRYKGQVMHLKGDFNKVYSMPDCDVVVMDMDSEKRAAKFKNSGLRKGMFGTRIYVVPPFDSDYERNDFQQALINAQGAYETNGVFLMEAMNISDEIDKQLKIIDLDSNFDDKIFEFSERSTAENIMAAFDVPSVLIKRSDSSIFGESGELLKQARIYLWEKKEEERAMLIDGFKRIFSLWHKPLNINDWSIKPLIEIQ